MISKFPPLCFHIGNVLIFYLCMKAKKQIKMKPPLNMTFFPPPPWSIQGNTFTYCSALATPVSLFKIAFGLVRSGDSGLRRPLSGS